MSSKQNARGLMSQRSGVLCDYLQVTSAFFEFAKILTGRLFKRVQYCHIAAFATLPRWFCKSFANR